jgi:hypothetical protein
VIKEIDIIMQRRYSENMYVVQWKWNIFFIFFLVY